MKYHNIFELILMVSGFILLAMIAIAVIYVAYEWLDDNFFHCPRCAQARHPWRFWKFQSPAPKDPHEK